MKKKKIVGIILLSVPAIALAVTVGLFFTISEAPEPVKIPEGMSALADIYPQILWPERDDVLSLDILSKQSFSAVQITSEYYSDTVEVFSYTDRNKQKRGLAELPVPKGLPEGAWAMELVLLKKGKIRGECSLSVSVRGKLADRLWTGPRPGTPAGEAVGAGGEDLRVHRHCPL